MPTEQCYKDIGALGARLDEIEKARIDRESTIARELTVQSEKFDTKFTELNKKLDDVISDRNKLIGIIWALRILFGALGMAVWYVLSHGLPEWSKYIFKV